MQSSSPQKATKKNDEQHISQVIADYISYWPFFILSIIMCIGASYVFNKYRIPMFEANATIIIKDEKKGNDATKEMQSLDIINTKKISENEVEVLQSRTIMTNVVKKLQLYASLKQEGKIKIVSAYVSSPVRVEFENPDLLQSPEKIAEKIYFQYNTVNNTVYIKNFNIKSNVNEWVKTPYGIMRFIPNPKFQSSGNNKPLFFEIYSVKDVTGSILGTLKVSGNKLSSIINLNLKDAVPERAEDILNELIYFYNEGAVNEKNGLVKNTLLSLEERLRVVKADLDSIESKIQVYKTGSNSPIELNQQGNQYLQYMSQTDAQYGQARVQMEVLNQTERFVTTNENNSAVLPSAVGLSDPALTNLIGELSKKQLEKERLKKTVGEGNPMIKALDDEIDKLKPGILSNIQNQRKNLAVNLNNLSATAGKYSSMLSTIPQKEKQLLEISRDRNIKSAIYSFLLQKREESELSYASIISDSRVVNTAQASSNPSGPSKMVVYLAALLIGLALPILTIHGKEAFSDKVLSKKEIEKTTSIPVVGELTNNKSKKQLVLEPGKRTFVAEEFRRLRISLLYLGIDAIHKKKLLVTSSIPGEGKSFIASNLAISLAMTGKKVVLVDLDLHDPSLGKIFDVENKLGVSDYLIKPMHLNDIICPTNIDNLSILPAGTLQDNPSEILLNGKIEQLIKSLENEFDLIVLDTAPTVFVTDAFLLTNLADATLYIVRHQHTPKLVIKKLDENVQINPLNNPAIIFNGVKAKGFAKTNYGYGYNYVYGQNANSKKKKIK